MPDQSAISHSAPTSVAYRKDIDGLRAIAVLSVVLYHAGVPRISGGFVGVDVFFVLSGYLITSLLATDLAASRFTLTGFYERRIRRLFPALAAVLLASFCAGAWILLPADFAAFGRTMLGALFFSSNIVFWSEAGYFDAPSHDKPLLHTWSLAVEEQYYLLFPLLLIFLWTTSPKRIYLWLLPFFLGSFAVSALISAKHSAFAFYLLPTRFWEILLGSLLAVAPIPRMHQHLRELAALLGMGLIISPILTFSAETVFPGYAALVPCMGTALVIFACTDRTTSVYRLLAQPLFVSVGKISYSLYLWHWPLLVFVRYRTDGDASAAATAAALLVATAAAYLSWRFVELPVRERRVLKDRRSLFTASIFTAAILSALGVYAMGQWGLQSRGPSTALELAGYAQVRPPRYRECSGPHDKPIWPEQSCTYGANVEATYALWGDSHALALIHGLGISAEKHGQAVRLFGFHGCPPALGIDRLRDSDIYKCAQISRSVVDFIESHPQITTVILAARYFSYLRGSVRLTDQSGKDLDSATQGEVFAEALGSTIDQIEKMGRRVVIVYPVPFPGFNVPKRLAETVIAGGTPESVVVPYSRAAAVDKETVRILDHLSGPIVRLYPHTTLCPNDVCRVYLNGHPLYYDDHHLSVQGATLVSTMFDPLFSGASDTGR